jgi:general secretion pathway protein B
MSLILDALKKSEAERQRQTGPTLLEVRVARPQRRYPLWALAVGILLAVNMILLLVFVLRPSDSGHASGVAAPTNPLPTPAVAPAAGMAATRAAPAPAAGSQPVPAATAPPAAEATSSPAPMLADSSAEATSNPADSEPAISAAAAGTRGQRDTAHLDYSALPGINETAASVPDLRLDLHVYAERPRDRYALINMQTVHEGDSLREGPRVLAITREGVALEWQNQQFMLRPQ